MVDYCFWRALKDMGVMVPVNMSPLNAHVWHLQKSDGLVDDDEA